MIHIPSTAVSFQSQKVRQTSASWKSLPRKLHIKSHQFRDIEQKKTCDLQIILAFIALHLKSMNFKKLSRKRNQLFHSFTSSSKGIAATAKKTELSEIPSIHINLSD
jgi:hypothetical protein